MTEQFIVMVLRSLSNSRAMALLLFLLLIPTEVRAHCLDVDNWGVGHAPIRVRLHDENADGLFVGLPVAQVGVVVARAIDNINENGMANIRLQWDGVVTSSPLANDGIISVTENNNPCGFLSDGCFSKIPALGGTYTDGFVELRSTQLWGFYSDFGAGSDARDIQTTLTHELLHSLGLRHSGTGGDCPGDPGVGVMHFNGSNQFTERRYLARDDIEGLWAIYGRRVGTVNHHESTDGIAWAVGTPALGASTYGPLSSASGTVAADPISSFSYLQTGQGYDRVRQRQKSAAGFSAQAFVTNSDATSRSFDAPASAFGNNVRLVAWMAGEQVSDPRKSIRVALSASGGAWTVYDLTDSSGAVFRTRRDGLAATYDPDTQRFVVAYLGENFPQNSDCNDPPGTTGYVCDDIRLVTLRTDGTGMRHTALSFNSNPVKSIDAPGLACRSGFGSVPCVMSWVSITGNSCVHWGRFDVLAIGDVQLYEDFSTNCIIGYQTPQIANVDTDATKLFRLTLRQEGNLGNGNRIYTLRHTAVMNSAWTDQVSFTVAPWVLSPTYGTFSIGPITEQDVLYVVPQN